MDRRVKTFIGGGIAFVVVLLLCFGGLFAAPLGGGGAIGGAVGGAAAEGEDRAAVAASCDGVAAAYSQGTKEAGPSLSKPPTVSGVDGGSTGGGTGGGSSKRPSDEITRESTSGGLTTAPSTGNSSGGASGSSSKRPSDGVSTESTPGASTAQSSVGAATGQSPTGSTAASTVGTGTPGSGGQPAQMPYPLPASHGHTGAEEPINGQGQVPSTGAKVTWPQFAALGQPYRDFYITMRWGYASWNWDGTSTAVDQAQYDWFAQKPRLVLVTNPRSHKSIVAAGVEAGPAPWVGVLSGGSGGAAAGPQHGWPNPTKGTPAGYTGIVAGFPPAAIAALGANTGYPGQTGDDLTFQWAPDQSVTPGPTGATAIDATGNLGGNGCLGVTSGTSCAVTGTYAGLTAEQQSNAQAIASVALQRGLGMDGAVMGIMVAMTEATLINVTHGDAMGPSSIGLFQQMPSWGSKADRLNPAKAAGFFFDALTKQSGWASKQPWMAAQAVQQSEFTDGSNYQQNYSLAVDIAKSLLNSPASPGSSSSSAAPPTVATSNPPSTGTSAAAGGADLASKWCTGTGGDVQVNGVAVTIPNKPDVPEALRGKTIQAPNDAMARGIAAGFGAIGLPYVWGGGGDGGTPPTDGCDRGGGALNSCQGIIGYDCSGFTAFVLGSAGFSIPAYSQAQRGGTPVPKSQARPGDLVVFIGHVAMYLGSIAGTEYFLQAPSPGHNVQIRPAYWVNSHGPADSNLYRWWK